MISLRKLGLAAALAALSFAVSLPAYAAASVAADVVEMCSPPGTGPTWAKNVTNPNTTTSYQLTTKGCAFMSTADMGYFRSQGFTTGGGTGVIFTGPFTAQSTTSNSPTLPAN